MRNLIRKILKEETNAPYGGKMSNTGLLYSKLENLKRHGIYKGDEKYDKILKQIEDIKKSGGKYKEPKKGFITRKIDDFKDNKRYGEMSDFEKKVYDYQKGYDNIDKRLLQYTKDFISYYNDVYGNKVGNMLYKPKLTDKEIAKFLTKHYREDIYPKLTGIYKNKILTHGTKDFKSLDVIDVDKHIGTHTGNKGHFGKGLYLTSSRDVGKHYGRTQPLVLHNIQNPFFIIPGDKNYYGSHDFKGMDFNSELKLGDIDVSIIPTEDDDNQKLLKKIKESPSYKCVGYAQTIPELDKQWEQNGKKESLSNLMSDLVSRFGISDELAKKLIKYAKINQKESFEFASLTGSKSLDTVYSQSKHDLIVTNKNTSGEGLGRFMDAEVVVKEPTSVVSIFPTFNAIMKSDGNSISRDLTSSNIHNESHNRVKKILKEETPNFSRFESKMFKLIDRIGVEKFIDEYLRDMGLTTEEEIDIVWKYFKEYGGGCDEYIELEYDSDDVSNLFKDGGYGIQTMVKKFLDDDYDYTDGYYECYYDEYQLGDINEENMKTIKKVYESQKEEDESIEEFIKNSDLESIIGCAYTDAQQSADIRALHDDFLDGLHDVSHKIEGKWDWETRTLKGRISFCELMEFENSFDILEDTLEQGYEWYTIVDAVKEQEWDQIFSGWGGDVLFGEPVEINEYRHFKYGGAGTIDTEEFNEILYNRLYDEYDF